MPRPLSNDIRERIRSVKSGMSRNAAAKKYDVSISSAVKIMQRWSQSGSYEPEPMGGYLDHKLSEHTELIEKFVQAKPDITLAELQERLRAKKITVSPTSIHRFLKYLNLSDKKPSTPASKTGLMFSLRVQPGRKANIASIRLSRGSPKSKLYFVKQQLVPSNLLSKLSV